MKYFVIAGEASGDLHGSNLINEIRKNDSEAAFGIVGGDLMSEQGGEPILHYRKMAFMGIWEVVKNIRQVSRNFRICKKALIDFQPDAVILIDYPGFNLRMAKFTKEKGYRVIYYISPKLWAWNSKRVEKIKKYVDHMLVILPFEVGFYKQFNYHVDYVGNPLLDAIEQKKPGLPGLKSFIDKNQLENKPIITVMAGSRKHEISTSLPVMLKMQAHFPGYQFVVAAAPSVEREFYEKYVENSRFRIVYNQTYALLSNSFAAIVNSGTATLETAVFDVPQVVCYRVAPISAFLIRMVIKVPYVSLVNLIMNEKFVQELLQDDFNEENLVRELQKITSNEENRRTMMKKYRELKDMLGQSGASQRAAGLINQYLTKREN
jgi:lipid-A-disaccharide synthase